MTNLLFSPPALGTGVLLTGLPGGSNKIHDGSPYRNIATITGATWIRLPSGLWCLSFDGMDDYITIASSPSTNITDYLTVKAWINAPGGLAGANAIVSKWNYGANKRVWIIAVGDAWVGGDAITVLLSADGTATLKQYNGSVDVCDGTWHQVGFTWAAGTLKLFEDGEEDGSVTKTEDNAGTAVLSDENVVGIGCSDVGATPGHDLNGKIALAKVIRGVWSAFDFQNSFDREKHLFGVW